MRRIVLALVRLSAAQLVVNEFASGDNVALGSTYGNDWFEIFNNGSSTEDLSQWSVKDSESAYVALGPRERVRDRAVRRAQREAVVRA